MVASELSRAKGEVTRLDEPARARIAQATSRAERELSLSIVAFTSTPGMSLSGPGAPHAEPTTVADRDAARIGRPSARSIGGLGVHARLQPDGLALELACQPPAPKSAPHVTLVAARPLGPTLSTFAALTGATVTARLGGAATPGASSAELRSLGGLFVDVVPAAPPTRGRAFALVGLAAAADVALVVLVSLWLARRARRPLVDLAKTTREALTDGPRPIAARGSRELEELGEALSKAVSELAVMKRRLAATERIAARREVARKVAHEIKNPLAPIRAAVETLRRLRARDDPAFDDYFDEATRTVLEEVHRIAGIVKEFTELARLPPPTLGEVDLGAIATHVATLHQAALDGQTARKGPDGARLPRVEVVTEGPLEVQGDRDQLVQVLTNLVQNGLEAASAVRDDPRVVLSLAPDPERPERVRLVVRDNGPGVAPDMVPRLFEPYATTKKTGTGLGLAIVQRIVYEHGGDITYRTGTKGGAVFELVLPRDGPSLLDKPLDVTSTHGPAREA
jgi:two-component system nitrogen regulation sensor histidine kinase NtrY